MGEIEYETEMECPDEERKHFEDKKTGVKLIHQGQEKKVIIVSTIRSSLEYVSMGSQNKLGFLFNSKRFNLEIKKRRTYDLCERENRSKVESFRIEEKAKLVLRVH